MRHSTPHIAFEGDEAATLRGLVGAGLGVSLLPPQQSVPLQAAARPTPRRAIPPAPHPVTGPRLRPPDRPRLVHRPLAATRLARLPGPCAERMARVREEARRYAPYPATGLDRRAVAPCDSSPRGRRRPAGSRTVPSIVTTVAPRVSSATPQGSGRARSRPSWRRVRCRQPGAAIAAPAVAATVPARRLRRPTDTGRIPRTSVFSAMLVCFLQTFIARWVWPDSERAPRASAGRVGGVVGALPDGRHGDVPRRSAYECVDEPLQHQGHAVLVVRAV